MPSDHTFPMQTRVCARGARLYGWMPFTFSSSFPPGKRHTMIGAKPSMLEKEVPKKEGAYQAYKQKEIMDCRCCSGNTSEG